MSRDFAAIVSVVSMNTNRINVSPSFSFVERLPLPYQNGCTPKVESVTNHYLICIESCLVEGLQPIERVPFTLLIVTPYNVTHLDQRDMENQTIADMIPHWYQRCEKQCSSKK